jgi:hypothetical protein
MERWSPARHWSPCMTGLTSFHKASCRAVNDVLLGYLLYKSRLVPRVLPMLAFIGAPRSSFPMPPCCSA